MIIQKWIHEHWPVASQTAVDAWKRHVAKLDKENEQLLTQFYSLTDRRDEVQTALTELSIEHEAVKKELAAKTAELESLKVKIVTKAKSKAKK